MVRAVHPPTTWQSMQGPPSSVSAKPEGVSSCLQASSHSPKSTSALSNCSQIGQTSGATENSTPHRSPSQGMDDHIWATGLPKTD